MIRAVHDRVWGEEADVVGDMVVHALADSQAGRFAIDHPHTQDWVCSPVLRLKGGGRGVGLDDVALCSILAGNLVDHLPVEDGDDVGALTTQKWLLDVVPEVRGLLALEPRRNQEAGLVRVVAEQLPEHREDALVAPQHLVGRLDPDSATRVLACATALTNVLHVCEACGAELLFGHELPRVELEDHVDVFSLLVVEAPVIIENDVLDVDGLDLVAGLLARVEQHEGVHDILTTVFVSAAGEVDGGTMAQGGLDELEVALPGHDQALRDVVPLVVALTSLTKPLPLGVSGLNQAGWGVGVELIQLGAAECFVRVLGSAKADVVAPVDAAVSRLLVPGLDDLRPGVLRNSHFAHDLGVSDDVVARLDQHVEDGFGGALQRGDLGEGERVERSLAPVVHDRPVRLLSRGVDQALLENKITPVGALLAVDASHQLPPLPPLAPPPEPPDLLPPKPPDLPEPVPKPADLPVAILPLGLKPYLVRAAVSVERNRAVDCEGLS